MKKVYMTEEMLAFLDDLDPLALEWADSEGIIEAISIRLGAQQNHIEYLRERLLLAEKVIGELYLMQRETDECV